MYLDFFSFERPPFRITPDPSLFFSGDEQGRGVVLDALIYGITSGEGILKVTGEVGSGKTMLCRMLEERLPDNVEIVYLANPSLNAREIVYAICFDLNLPVTPETDRLIVLQKLQEYLVEKHGQGGTVVVFIDDAQGMPLETLEEIRLLSNLETRQNKLMQIVLFGQPELDKLLQQKSIRQLKERITHSFNLQPLSDETIRDYLRFRLRTAGCPWPQLFSPKAEKMLARGSSGLTRRINILADKSLLAAYADSSIRENARNSKGQLQPMVLPRHVRIAIKDSGFQRLSSTLRPILIGVGVTALLGLGVAIGWFWWSGNEMGEEVEASSATPSNRQTVTDSQQEQTLTPERPGENSLTPEPAALAGQVPEAQAESGFPPEPAALTDAGQAAGAQPVMAVMTESQPLSTAEEQEDTEARVQTQAVTVASGETVPETPETADVEEEAEAGLEESGIAGSDIAGSEIAGPEIVEPEILEAEIAESERSDRSGLAEAAVAGPVEDEQSAPSPQEATTAALPEGLITQRMVASKNWLQTLPDQGYTVQLLSVSSTQDFILQDFLQLMQTHELLKQSYICSLSVNQANVPNRLVVYGEFQGLSLARQFINSLPDEVAQYAPFVRNLNDISCTNPL